jgi:hypothetical protein
MIASWSSDEIELSYPEDAAKLSDYDRLGWDRAENNNVAPIILERTPG